MFENKEYIKNIVSMRDDGEIVIPLYIQIYGQKYSLLELDTIKKRFSRSVFKIGFATADAFFMNNSFPVNRINEFNLINSFTEYDESMNRNIRYTVFESGDVDVKDNDKLGEEIHMYFDLLFNNVKERVDAYFKSLIEQETVPLIPRHIPIADENDDDIPYPSADDEDDEYVDEEESIFEDDEDYDEEESSEVAFEFENDYDDEYYSEDKHEKEEIPIQFGIKGYTGELSRYSSSWDPKFVNEETAEDPLDELRKEVEEYSQDEEDNNLLIVETDNTGTEIVSATEATLDLPKDDYLSETEYPKVKYGSFIGNETVDFMNGEGKYSDNDYPTDFDIY